jgi:hypothetical protein
MKYLKKYNKIFESSDYQVKYDIIDEFDEDFINSYFKKIYSVDESEIHNYMYVWNYVDDERFVKDYINDRINGERLVDMEKEDLRQYIINNLLTSEHENVSVFIYKKGKKLGLDEDVDLDDIVKKLGKKDLINIISFKADKEEECIRDYWEGIYLNSDAKEILGEIYGENDLQQHAIEYIENYIDKDKMIEDYYENEDFSYKKEYLSEQLDYDKKLQKMALKNDPSNSIKLLDIMDDDEHSHSIGDTYKYQNIYMKSVLKEMVEEDEDDLYVAKMMKKLNDKFEILPKIREKYEKYTFYIDTENYNL